MAHQRERYLEPLVRKALKFSPIVGILGQRQTGKTTLVSGLAESYSTLDDRPTLELATLSPESLLSAKNGQGLLAIDECQLAPPLFPALKEAVRLNPAPGQFLLTGSVRFTSRKVIRESLTGRIFNLELLPLAFAEAHRLPLSNLPHVLLASSDTAILRYLDTRGTLCRKKGDWKTSLVTGGLPGIAFHREPAIRTRQFNAHLETLLERDLRQLLQTKISYLSLITTLTRLAETQGHPLDLSSLARAVRISRATLRNLISVFESMFLIRTLATEGGTARPTLFFEDQGLATHLLQDRSALAPAGERSLFSNLLPQFFYNLSLNARPFFYLTRGGARVPAAFRTQQGTIGFIYDTTDGTPSLSAILSARSFLKAIPGSKVLIAHEGQASATCLEKGCLYAAPIYSTL